jgi:hypothetical protein
MNECSDDNTKKIIIVEKKINPRNTTGIRKVVTKNKWDFEESDFLFTNQLENIKKIHENHPLTPHMEIYASEIKNKLNGYRHQDIVKKKLDENKFIDFKTAIKLLVDSNLECFYCKEKVQVLYQPSRTPSQWTLERVDNNFGHNKDNLKIACLNCNLRRKTMYHERFAFTKQLGQITKLDSIN